MNRLPYLLSTYRSEDRVIIQCESEEKAEEALSRVMTWLHSLRDDTGIEFLQTWMRTPNPMLGNIAPLAMMKMGKGARLAQFIESAYEAEQPPLGTHKTSE